MLCEGSRRQVRNPTHSEPDGPIQHNTAQCQPLPLSSAATSNVATISRSADSQGVKRNKKVQEPVGEPFRVKTQMTGMHQTAALFLLTLQIKSDPRNWEAGKKQTYKPNRLLMAYSVSQHAALAFPISTFLKGSPCSHPYFGGCTYSLSN